MPTDRLPGAGLPAYFQAYHIGRPSLVITRNHSGKRRELPSHVSVKAVDYPDTALVTGWGWHALKSWLVKLMGYAVFLLRSIGPMVRFRPTIVHVHTALPLLQGLFARLFLRSRVILQFHGSDLLRVSRIRFLQRLVSLCDLVMYVSKDMEPALKSFLPADKLCYVPNGVDTRAFQNRHEPRLQQVCMIGSLRWQKGYPYALEAFARFSEHHPGWNLIVAGDGPLADSLKQRASQLGISDKVEFSGTMERAHVASLLNRSRIFLLSSVSEGFPKVVVEAMACGTPVVATAVGSCPEIVPGAGIVVPSQDPGAIQVALCKLAQDGALWEECSEVACRRARECEWSRVAALVESVYRSLAESGRPETPGEST